MTLREYIEMRLRACGYYRFEWHYGNQGYYIMAECQTHTQCINVGEWLNDEIKLELKYGIRKELETKEGE